ncbi:virulence sensor protein bvgS [Verticillium dahliae]|nr:virulence sensor protein bvgS [Verticillium dahliae]
MPLANDHHHDTTRPISPTASPTSLCGGTRRPFFSSVEPASSSSLLSPLSATFATGPGAPGFPSSPITAHSSAWPTSPLPGKHHLSTSLPPSSGPPASSPRTDVRIHSFALDRPHDNVCRSDFAVNTHVRDDDISSERQKRRPHHLAGDDWSSAVSRYGLTTTPTPRDTLFSTFPHASTTWPPTTARSTYTKPQQPSRRPNPLPAKRPSEEDTARSGAKSPPLKKPRTRLLPPRAIDLSGVPRTPTAAAALALLKSEGVTSPLFFSNSPNPMSSRAPFLPPTDAAAALLARLREENDVRTVRLPRGHVSSASPARSGSTSGSGSWSSIEPGGSSSRSPSSQYLPPGLQLLNGCGVIELLEQDERPTFIIDLANPVNGNNLSLHLIYANASLRASSGVLELLSLDGEKAEQDPNYTNFKAWVMSHTKNNEGMDVCLSSHLYGNINWTCSTLRKRFRFVSGNTSAVSLMPSSPGTAKEAQVLEERTRGPTPTSNASNTPLANEPDYFGVELQPEISMDLVPTGDSAMQNGVDECLEERHHSDEFTQHVFKAGLLRPSFDWTRITITPELSEHILFARNTDWGATSLGPLEYWSADLRAMANMVMGSPHPAALYWGPEFVTIYNEAYIELAGQKHPSLMGMRYADAWSEIWDDLQPIMQSAWDSGQSTLKNDNQLFIDRHGFTEEAFFSWSLVPLVGSDGEVVGIYNPAFENTRRKVNERRMLTLREVGEKTAAARDVRSFWPRDDSESEMSSMHSGSVAHPPLLQLEEPRTKASPPICDNRCRCTARPSFSQRRQLFIHLLSRQLATSLASVVLFEEEIKRGQRAARLAALDREELRTELILRTQEAVESEYKFTRMAEFAPVGMFIANGAGQFNFANDTWWQISRHPRGEDSTDTWMQSIRDEDRAGVEMVWQALLTDKVAITHEFRFKCSRQNGDNTIDTWVLMSAFPERDEEGNLKSIFGCITDISSQKWAEAFQMQRREEAVELKRQQENFIDITSHEMRNPLSAILQCADEIANTTARYRERPDAQPVQTLLDVCTEAANTINLCASHQHRIVDDILTLSKLDSQLLLVTPVDAHPVNIVENVLKMFEAEVQAHDIELQFSTLSAYTDYGIDWRRISITLTASRDLSEVKETSLYFPSRRSDLRNLTSDKDWGDGDEMNLHFSVQDTGPGLREEEKKILFQRFSQASPRTHVQYGGSGLGLFISRMLTELQGGQIGVVSKEGLGSTFSFFIKCRKTAMPAEESNVAANRAARPGRVSTPTTPPPPTRMIRRPSHRPAADASQSPGPVPASGPTPSKTGHDVLIVEDNIVNQKVLQRQLKNCGNVTHVANHGGEALDALKKCRFWTGKESEGYHLSVILMDLEMPVMDGMTCARRIRELEREGVLIDHIPIIAVTAYARPEQIEDAKAAGIDDVISKPFRIPDLTAKMNELVSKYSKLIVNN